MTRINTWSIVAALAAVMFLLVPQRAEAIHRQTPPLVQVTQIPQTAPPVFVLGGHSFMRTDIVVFHSDQDLLGNGNSVSRRTTCEIADT